MLATIVSIAVDARPGFGRRAPHRPGTGIPLKVGAFDQLDHNLFELLARQAGSSLARTALTAEMDCGPYLH